MMGDRYKDGFLVPTLACVMAYLMRVFPMGWLECVWPRRFKEPSPVDTERYVLGWLVFGLVISIAVCSLYDCVAAVRWLVYIVAGLRGLEIIVRAASVGDIKNVVDPVRTLVLAAINYVELMLWFGLIYALNYQSLVDQSLGDHSAPAGPITAFYFSIITQLTIGYGDVYATGWLRIVAAAQGLIGALFVIAVLGRAVSR
jgi:hypothetical protein